MRGKEPASPRTSRFTFHVSRLPRFFVPNDTLRGKQVRIGGEVAHQISRVLRMRPGDEVALLDGLGYEYRVKLEELGKDHVSCLVMDRKAGAGEPAHQVDLYLSLLNKPDKFEWALQKCTELGAGSFRPLIVERSVSGPPEPARRQRWERIIMEAAEQSGRSMLPPLEESLSLQAALAQEGQRLEASDALRTHLALMPAPGADMSLDDALEEIRAAESGSVSLFIGPEGGFTEDELWQANEQGVYLIDLGPRILRSETAAVATLTMVMHELSELKSSL